MDVTTARATRFEGTELRTGVVWGRGQAADQLDADTETDYILEQQS